MRYIKQEVEMILIILFGNIANLVAEIHSNAISASFMSSYGKDAFISNQEYLHLCKQLWLSIWRYLPHKANISVT